MTSLEMAMVYGYGKEPKHSTYYLIDIETGEVIEEYETTDETLDLQNVLEYYSSSIRTVITDLEDYEEFKFGGVWYREDELELIEEE